MEWMMEFQRVARIATWRPWRKTSHRWSGDMKWNVFLYFEKKEKCCMMKQIEMITECISACDEIIMFGHGYKSHSSWGAQDQFDDVTSLINICKHLLVILILYHNSKEEKGVRCTTLRYMFNAVRIGFKILKI